MKLTVLQENLSKAINLSSRFTSSRVQLPVLANILLTAKKNKLYISATNLESSINISVGAKVEKEGDITVPGKTISEIVQNLDPGQIVVAAEKEVLSINADNFSSSVSGMNSSDFPVVPNSLSGDASSYENKLFKSALGKVLYAVSADETRPALTGVLLVVEDGISKLVSTDGFRLAQLNMGIDTKSIKKNIIIPKNCLMEVERLLSEDGEFKISLNESDNQIVFEVGSAILSSRLIEGEYPDFERIIPKSTKINVDVDKEEFLKAVKLGGVFARDAANVVKLEVGEGYVDVLAESSRSGNQKTRVDAKVEKEGKDKLMIAFNYKFLEDYANSIDGENISMGFNDSDSPGIFTDPKDKNYLHIIMPVKI